MIDHAWSFVLTVLGATGLYLAGGGRSWAWLYNLALQLFWLAYALSSHQCGFILAAVLYGGVAWRNYRRARRHEKGVFP